MVINHIDKLFVTSDAFTVIREVEVHHPAAKMVAMAAKMQQDEAGDGTNFVISLAGELMLKAEYLLKMGLHPSIILSGFEKASNKALSLIEEMSQGKVEDVHQKAELLKCLKSVVGAKIYGQDEFMSSLIADACIHTMPKNNGKFNVENVRTQKILGGSIHESMVVHGMVLLRPSLTSVTAVKDAKIAVYNTPIEMQQGDTKGTVLLKNAEDLLTYTKGEEEQMEKFVQSIAEAGVNVVLCQSSISELAVHFLEKYKILTIKIMSKFELKRVAKSVGAQLLVKLGAPTPDEIGFANSVELTEISSTRCTVIRRDEDENKIATIVLRGSTYSMLDDLERVIDDAVNNVKCVSKDPRLLAGAGAAEIQLSREIQELAKSETDLDQYAIEAFGQAFEIIPKTLASNAGLKAEEVIANLYAAQNPKFGIDITDGSVKDMTEHGIYDCLDIKSWAIKLTIDAVLTILKVDQIIMSKPSGGPNTNRPAPVPQGYGQ
jgi:T-complex protein 1 subunit theta